MALKEKEQALIYIDARLHEWAQWYGRHHQHLGYPSSSIEYRIYREGGILIRGTGEKPLPINERADEIDALLREMQQHSALLATAIRCQYIMPGGLRQKAKHLDISYTQFKQCVDMAMWWLMGKLK